MSYTLHNARYYIPSGTIHPDAMKFLGWELVEENVKVAPHNWQEIDKGTPRNGLSD